MIILDEKMPPPPPYAPPRSEALCPPPFPVANRPPPTLMSLPPHLLLRIVYDTFSRPSCIERQRKTLYWLNMSLRLVNRALYIACMHVLRSTYLPAYSELIRPPYTSDPFPHTSPSFIPDPNVSPVQSLQRETKVLDLFIALKVREDVWADDTELHLERDDGFRDLFDLNQPRSRLEDLVRAYGVREGVLTVSNSSNGTTVVSKSQRSVFGSANGVGIPQSGSNTSLAKAKMPTRTAAVPFSSLSVSFSSRRVGLILTTRERKKTVVEVERTRDEKLEVAAKKLVREFKAWLAASR